MTTTTTPQFDAIAEREAFRGGSAEKIEVELKLGITGTNSPESLGIVAFIASRALVQALCKSYPSLEVEDIIAAIDQRWDDVRQEEIDDKSNSAYSVRKRIANMSDAEVVRMWRGFAR